MAKQVPTTFSSTQFLVFKKADGDSIEVLFEEDTIWLSQKTLAELFDVDVRTISEHLTNIFKDGELDRSAVIRKFRITAQDGKSYSTNHYNLDAIISVGYRVNSIKATQFRQWATSVLRTFTIQGYVIDKRRMESGRFFENDYFEQLLQEIREIRLSERRFYQKVTDIFATSIDYEPNTPEAKKFFSTVQNKLHYATHSQTAAELIYSRADSTKRNMGLTTWQNSPNGKILKADVTVGKNYLTEDELNDLGRLVESFLNLAESRAERHIPTTMAEWSSFLDQVLTLDARELLTHAGSISKDDAEQHAHAEYDKYRVIQDALYVSDFDRFVGLPSPEQD